MIHHVALYKLQPGLPPHTLDDMIRRTRTRLDQVNDSVRYLHMCAGLRLNFETEGHEEQFVSQLQTRPVTWLQAA